MEEEGVEVLPFLEGPLLGKKVRGNTSRTSPSSGMAQTKDYVCANFLMLATTSCPSLEGKCKWRDA